MGRPLDLNRNDAELLDDALLALVKGNPAYDRRAIELAAELCRIWGMAPWWKRTPAIMSEAEWAATLG